MFILLSGNNQGDDLNKEVYQDELFGNKLFIYLFNICKSDSIIKVLYYHLLL